MFKKIILIVGLIFLLSGCADILGTAMYYKETTPHSLNISLGDTNKRLEQRDTESNKLNNFINIFNTYIEKDKITHNFKF